MTGAAPRQATPTAHLQPSALRVTLVYAAVSASWIFVSDWLLGQVVIDGAWLSVYQMLKGWAFVAVTSLVLYGLMGRVASGVASPAPAPDVAAGQDAGRRLSLVPLAVVGVVIALVTTAAVYNSFRQARLREAARIEAVADLHVAQFTRWLAEHEAQVGFVSSSSGFAELYRRWHDGGDVASGEQFLGRLNEFSAASGYDHVRVLDVRGSTVLATAGAAAETRPEIRRAAMAAMATGTPTHSETYPLPSTEGQEVTTFAIIAPLLRTGRPAQAAVAFRVEPENSLFPALRAWPIPSASGRALLVRRDGDRIVGVSGRSPLPISTPDLLAARVIRGESPEGIAIDAHDHRGVAVLGAVRRVRGTDLYLVAKVDRAEIYAGAAREAAWIVAAGLLALFAASVAAYLWRERGELRVALIQKAEHAEALKALRLLDAIAENSTDAIFAKDLAGRYLLFNRGASLITGKSRAQVLGRDDRAIFPAAEADVVMRNDASAMQGGCTRTYEETVTTVAGEATFLATKGPLRDADHKVIGMYGISRDITGRMRAEKAVRESAERYESLFANMLNGLAHCRMFFDGDQPVDWEYLAVNPAFEQLTGLRDIVGRRASEVVPGLLAENPELLDRYGDVVLHGEPDHFESYVVALKSWLSVSVYRPAEAEFVATFENISERKRAEAAQRASEERLRIFVDHAPAAIAMFDRDMRYLAVSHRWLVDYGVGERDVIGLTHYDVFPETPQRWKEIHRRCLAGKIERCEEDQFARAGGGIDWMTWEIRPWYDDQDAVGGLLLFSERVNERKQADLALRESRQRLEMALAAAHMGIWEWNFRSREVYWSPEVWRLFGIEDPVSRARGMTFERFKTHVHPDDVGRVVAATEASTYAEEFRVALPDGRIRWLYAVGRAAPASAGESARAFGVVLDVDARKRTEAALLESADTVRAVGNSVLAHLAVLDRQGKIVDVNQAWATFALENGQTPGVPPARTGIGADYLAVCREAVGEDAAYAKRACDGIRAILDGRQSTFALEYPCHSPARQRWFQMSVTPLATLTGGAVVVHIDITERVRAELAVRASEANYRSMVSALSEGVIVFDRAGKVHQCNPSAERILELSQAQMVEQGRSSATWRTVWPDGTPCSPAEFPVAVTLAGGEPQRGIVLGDVRPDGRIAWLMFNSEPIREPTSRRLSGAIVSFTDISERFARDQELRKLSLAVEQSPESIVMTDLDGRIEYVNEAFTRVSGYRRSEVLGRNPRVLQSGLTPRSTYEAMWDALTAGNVWHGEFENKRKSGESYTEVAHVSPVRSFGGKVTHYVAIKEDVTERKRLEQELDQHRHHLEELVARRTSEMEVATRALVDAERFAQIVADNIPGGVAYWDRELQCRFANKTYLDWLGLAPRRWQGRGYADLMGERIFGRNERHMRDALLGVPQSFERTVEQGPSPGRHIHIHYVPDIHDGDVRGFFVLVTDVTASKQDGLRLRRLNEALTVARDKADDANLAKSAFLANMSHEIRTPMNAIIGLTHLIRRDSSDPAQTDRLAKVSIATNHLLQVINDILDLSKIESGKLKIEAIDFSPHQLLLQAIELVAESARVKRLEIVSDTSGLPAELRGDPTRLSQALLNLLGNAVKFTDEGSIVVRGELLEDSGSDLLVRFTVRDTGIGIAHDKLGRLFSAFVQADPSMTRRFGGTGLGLAITRHLALLMGGDVGVRSEPGIGSTFWFTARLARPGHSDAPAGRSPVQGFRALLADDPDDGCDAITIVLEGLGLHVDTAASAGEVVSMANARAGAGEPYAVILVDCQTAGASGADTLRRLRGLDGGIPSPLVLLTAADAIDQSEANAPDFAVVLVKPITPPVLRETLMHLLQEAPRVTPVTVSPSVDEALLRSRHAGARVLVAEDNLANQEVAVELLQGAGLVVEVAATGTEALIMASRDRYDMILMDVQMPEMDGLAATRAIRNLADGRSVPILAMTASAFGEDRAACLAAGMNDCIAKPADPNVLFATMLRWLPARAFDLPAASGASVGADPDAAQPMLSPLAGIAGLDIVGGLALTGEISSRLRLEAGEASRAVTPREVVAALDRVEGLLEVADFDVGAAFQAAAPLLRAALGSAAMELEIPLRNFNYPAALAVLRELRERLGDAHPRSPADTSVT